jgi:hypothetical protein
VGSLLLFPAGEFLLVALAVALPSWGHLAIAAGAINVAALLLFPLMTESPRWLLSQGKQQQATELLQAIATANGSRMPAQPLVCSKETVCPSDAASHCSYSDSDSDAVSSTGNIVGGNSSTAKQQLGLMAILKNRSLLIRSAALLVTWYALMQVGRLLKKMIRRPCAAFVCLYRERLVTCGSSHHLRWYEPPQMMFFACALLMIRCLQLLQVRQLPASLDKRRSKLPGRWWAAYCYN